MSHPKRHHYVPESYLVRFTKERTRKGCLFVYDFDAKEIRPQLPKDTCVEGYFNAVELDDGTRSFQLEEALSKIEGAAIPVIDKIEARESLIPEDKGALAVFVALQMMRGPEFKRQIGGMLEEILKLTLQTAFATEDRAKQSLEQFESDTGGSLGMSVAEMIEFVRDDKYRIETHRNESIRIMVNLAERTAKKFSRMDWTFLHAPADRVFVTSDQPFHINPPPGPRPPPAFANYGYGTLGTEKLVPLSSSVALVMGDAGTHVRHVDGSVDSVRTFNIGIASSAPRFLITGEEALLASFVRSINRAERRRR